MVRDLHAPIFSQQLEPQSPQESQSKYHVPETTNLHVTAPKEKQNNSFQIGWLPMVQFPLSFLALKKSRIHFGTLYIWPIPLAFQVAHSNLTGHHLGGLALTAAAGMVQHHATSATPLTGKAHAEDAFPEQRESLKVFRLKIPFRNFRRRPEFFFQKSTGCGKSQGSLVDELRCLCKLGTWTRWSLLGHQNLCNLCTPGSKGPFCMVNWPIGFLRCFVEFASI